LSRRNRARVDEADSEVQDYTDQRIDAFRAHSDVVYLDDLERGVFGWTEDAADQADSRQSLFSPLSTTSRQAGKTERRPRGGSR
jgi:hypothetical protein